MELILISKSKLKIMLSREDMKKYNLDTERCSALRGGFMPLLERARRECGFEAEGGRLMVRVFPSREGGCEMFVSCVVGSGGAGEVEFEKVSAIFETLYLFDSLSLMVEACAVLKKHGYGKNSTAYSLEGGRFALLLTDIGEREICEGVMPLDEYGTRLRAEGALAYIGEHSSVLAGDAAVDTLAKFSIL